ncbi:MAG: Holliday junction resolvase RuvX [Patescibacteria group bacterium]
MKILAIDYGSKKIGLAISDETQSIALPFLFLENRGDKNLTEEIYRICQKNKVGEIVLGMPKTMAGQEGKQAQRVKKFAKLLKKKVDLSIIFEDERLTSKLAQRFLEKNKKEDDRIAAQILLQDYLDKSQNV